MARRASSVRGRALSPADRCGSSRRFADPARKRTRSSAFRRRPDHRRPADMPPCRTCARARWRSCSEPCRRPVARARGGRADRTPTRRWPTNWHPGRRESTCCSGTGRSEKRRRARASMSRIFFAQYMRMWLCMKPVCTISRIAAFQSGRACRRAPAGPGHRYARADRRRADRAWRAPSRAGRRTRHSAARN